MSSTQIFIAIGVIAFVVSYFLTKKIYFKKIIQITDGYNPLDLINSILLFVVFAIGVIYIGSYETGDLPRQFIFIILIPFGILLIRNIIKIKIPLHIIITTLLQITIGTATILVSIIFFLLEAWAGSGNKAVNYNTVNNNSINNNNSQMVSDSWRGHEYDNKRANELGFNTVEEAIKEGYMYNGTKFI